MQDQLAHNHPLHVGPLCFLYQTRSNPYVKIADSHHREQGEGVQVGDLQDNGGHARNGAPHPAIPNNRLILIPYTVTSSSPFPFPHACFTAVLGLLIKYTDIK